MTDQSGLILRVADAEPLVGPTGRIRTRHDDQAGRGIPAHVTVLYPWVPPDAITDEDVDALCEIACGTAPFHLTFAEIGRFPEEGVVYLVPEPGDAIRALTATVAGRWPDHPPYEGRFDDVVPHLTISNSGEPVGLDDVESQLPLTTIVTELSLFVRRDGTWSERLAVRLGGP